PSLRAECDRNRIDQAAIVKAINYYEDAASTPNTPPLASVADKATLGVGRAHLCLYLSGVEPSGHAEDQFRQLVQRFENGRDLLQDLAAEAYAALGLIDWTKANMLDQTERQQVYTKAAGEYLRAVIVLTAVLGEGQDHALMRDAEQASDVRDAVAV